MTKSTTELADALEDIGDRFASGVAQIVGEDFLAALLIDAADRLRETLADDATIAAKIEARIAELRRLASGDVAPLQFVNQQALNVAIWELEALL